MMIDLWLAIGVSAILITTIIYYSVDQYLAHSDASENNISSKNVANKYLLLMPILFLLSSIGLYSQNPTVELQQNWINTQIETKNSFHLIEENIVKNKQDKPDIQSMLLGLRTLVYNEPENAELWFMLAESYFQLSMVDLADESMKRAIRLKSSANWYVAYAQILALRSSESDLSRAIGFLRSAIQLEPNHQSAMLTMGFLYARQQKNSQAIEIWEFLADKIDKSGADSSRIRQQIESISAKKGSNLSKN